MVVHTPRARSRPPKPRRGSRRYALPPIHPDSPFLLQPQPHTARPATRRPGTRYEPFYARPTRWLAGARSSFRIARATQYELHWFAPGDARDYGTPDKTSTTLPITTDDLPIPISGEHQVGMVVRYRDAYDLTDHQAGEHVVEIDSAAAAGTQVPGPPSDVTLDHDSSGNVTVRATYAANPDGSASATAWNVVPVLNDAPLSALTPTMSDVDGVVRLALVIVSGASDGDIVSVTVRTIKGAVVSETVEATLTVDLSVPSADVI